MALDILTLGRVGLMSMIIVGYLVMIVMDSFRYQLYLERLRNDIGLGNDYARHIKLAMTFDEVISKIDIYEIAVDG